MAESELELRDWGTMETVPMREGHEVQQITVNPGARMPLRVNDYQCEHWVVLRGIARVHIDHKSSLVDEGASIFIPARAGHSIENLGNVPLRVVAIHYGAEWPSSGEQYVAARRAYADTLPGPRPAE
jgi:mannose-1-phosphate guanylyltransferase